MTKSKLVELLKAYDTLKADVLDIVKNIHDHSDAEEIDYMCYDEKREHLSVGYTVYCRGYEDFGSVDIPISIITTDPGEDRKKLIEKHNANLIAAELELKKQSEAERDERDRLEYERLKAKFEK